MVESLLETLTTERSHLFYKPIPLLSVTNAKGKIVSLINLWNILNQLGKHHFSYGLIFLK